MSSPTDHSSTTSPRWLILYDGTCGFCDASVQWLIAHDRDRTLRYAALQGDTGLSTIERHRERLSHIDSIVLVDAHEDHEQVYVFSDAALRIAALLPSPWSLARHLQVVPRVFRDAIYRLIARHRLKFFGQLESCRLPRPEERVLFLP